jgi:hypothetical protein
MSYQNPDPVETFTYNTIRLKKSRKPSKKNKIQR